MSTKTGVLLVNLGTPDDPEIPAVRRYLKQFLSDPRVIDIPALARWLLLRLFILPFRPKKSSEAYKLVWTDKGSPLDFHTKGLAEAVGKALGPQIMVRYAMRYQNPSLPSVLDEMKHAGVDHIIVLPLYPQYASSSTGSTLEELYRLCGAEWNAPSLAVIPPFYGEDVYLDCVATVAREAIQDFEKYDHFLFSFHGLPERQILKSDWSKKHCLASGECCNAIGDVNRFCYRAQCVHVAREVAKRLGVPVEKYSVGFQSRLGRSPWIQPFTDVLFTELPKKGVKNLAVLIPSFTADCLETLEEIAIRGRDDFKAAGGSSFLMTPSLNDHPAWVDAVTTMVRQYTSPRVDQK